MTRPSLLLIVAVLAGSPGCAGGDAARPFSGAPATLSEVRSAPRGSAGPAFAIDAPQAPQPARDRAAVAEACRRDADRIVLYRDRGQLMREDERDARVGTEQSIYARRVEIDRLGRIFERDRIAAECLRQQGTSAPPRR